MLELYPHEPAMLHELLACLTEAPRFPLVRTAASVPKAFGRRSIVK